MKVLLFGASGFVGFPIAQAFSRAGHIVYGITRSEAKAKKLAADEIFPIISEPTNIQAWAHLIPTVDVVVEAIGDSCDREAMATTLLNAVGHTANSTRQSGPKISYIFTSGAWVHGPSPDEFVADTTPLLNPLPLVAWRTKFEQTVLQDPRVNGIIVRPALLYGRGASLLAPVFEAAATGREIVWYGKPGGRLTLIHPDDLADLYVRVAEKGPVLGGLTIDANNEYTEPVEDFLQKLVKVSGSKGPYKLLEPTNPYEEALATTILSRPYLAKSLLGWQPKKPGLTEGLALYYAAFKASRGN